MAIELPAGATSAVTDEDLMALTDDGCKHELVDGEITTMPTSGEHEDIGMVLAALLRPHALAIGRMYGSSVGCRMQGGNVRSPDVSVMRRERLPNGRSPRSFLEGAPDLCVEIISPSEDRRDILRKLNEYFDSGAEQVWLVYPETRTVAVYSLAADWTSLGPEDELTGGALMPGFRCKVAEIFQID
ncbi:MAG TPA: Uma2 family endonuclease [Armatimonadota bacterium]|jgi:Uma2 family endonuclease